MRRLLLLVGLILVMTACGDWAGPFGFLQGVSGAADGNWVLVSGTTDDGEPMTVFDGQSITLTLDSERVNGHAACNSYSGQFTLERDGTFRIVDGLAVTEMWCSPEEVMEAEQTFLDVLQRVNQLSMDGDQLVASAAFEQLRFEDSGTPLPDGDRHPDEPTTDEPVSND